MQEGGKEDDVTAPTDVTLSSGRKVQEWLDRNSDEILFTPATGSISPASCIILSSGDDDDDDDDDDGMQATVDFADIIQDHTEAILNQQSFDATLEEASVLYVCNEVCRILNLSKDEVYTSSFGLIQHSLRWTAISVNDRLSSL